MRRATRAVSFYETCDKLSREKKRERERERKGGGDSRDKIILFEWLLFERIANTRVVHKAFARARARGEPAGKYYFLWDFIHVDYK